MKHLKSPIYVAIILLGLTNCELNLNFAFNEYMVDRKLEGNACNDENVKAIITKLGNNGECRDLNGQAAFFINACNIQVLTSNEKITIFLKDPSEDRSIELMNYDIKNKDMVDVNYLFEQYLKDFVRICNTTVKLEQLMDKIKKFITDNVKTLQLELQESKDKDETLKFVSKLETTEDPHLNRSVIISKKKPDGNDNPNSTGLIVSYQTSYFKSTYQILPEIPNEDGIDKSINTQITNILNDGKNHLLFHLAFYLNDGNHETSTFTVESFYKMFNLISTSEFQMKQGLVEKICEQADKEFIKCTLSYKKNEVLLIKKTSYFLEKSLYGTNYAFGAMVYEFMKQALILDNQNANNKFSAVAIVIPPVSPQNNNK